MYAKNFFFFFFWSKSGGLHGVGLFFPIFFPILANRFFGLPTMGVPAVVGGSVAYLRGRRAEPGPTQTQHTHNHLHMLHMQPTNNTKTIIPLLQHPPQPKTLGSQKMHHHHPQRLPPRMDMPTPHSADNHSTSTKHNHHPILTHQPK